KVNEKKIKIIRLKELPDTLDSHMLFIASSEKKRLPEILARVKHKPILTIGDTKDFGKKGVAFNFIVDKGKIKFEVNSSVLDSASLQVSSQLLKLAIFVKK
ncbi:YfiR family protein, partial [Fibrobacterota bacterium]